MLSGNFFPGVLRDVRVLIIENGYVVLVYSPPLAPPDSASQAIESMTTGMASILSSVNKAGGSGFVEGVDEATDPYKENDDEREKKNAAKLKKIQDEIRAQFRNRPKPKSPYEVYVFLDKKKLVAFLDEALIKPEGTALDSSTDFFVSA